ncbi:uncharacterized membrane protein YsdA (DUF1294 family)/cold shock CspA family protein [Inhella inkyongensis]|uniref:Uncharacterized membrane protein YsdA (DUF1294 family)/cold shock CspA family protein n=1 Tax=Inhella inkyongensis TaxID=392593 RepID=A0A840S0W2_9BURK|nr:DUF1294 domain-containing protein [Inhella inkyongensis]MBB5203905.1 uncharacterized membrane protein YsdA (DUF1294 family)/cold shock CspA family protein [Inhella inkyongensis]
MGAAPQERGRVSQWDAAKGLGFVQPEAGGPRLLLRRVDLAGRLRFTAPALNEPVRFTRAGPREAPRATQVHTLRPPPVERVPRSPTARSGSPEQQSRQLSSQRLLIIPVFALLLGAIHLAWPLAKPVPMLYSALSMALFVVYGLDKWAAKRGTARVAETSLHLIALMGGWPGALLGQHIFRHKTAKPSFLRWTWAMVALNLLLLVGLCTPAWEPWWQWIQQFVLDSAA